MSNSPPPPIATKKHSPSTNITPDIKKSSSSSSSFVIRRSISFAYGFGFTFALVACTIFFVFNNSNTPIWFKSRSHFSTLFSHFFPTSSSSSSSSPQVSITRSSYPTAPFSRENDGFSEKINTSSVDENAMANSSSQYAKIDSIKGFKEEKTVLNDGFLLKKEGEEVKQSKEDWLDLIDHCNLFNGSWVRDDSYPLYEAGSCPHIDKQFNCFLNGRRENKYENFRWQPNGCNIPRLNGRELLELLRGKRLAYVGDSLNRNMWESMVCILRNSVDDKSKVFEASGRNEFRSEGSYSFVFADYNCSVEFFRSPFLVQEWETDYKNGLKRSKLRLDVIERSSDRYRSADVLIFNTGHWWTRGRTSRGKGYFQEGSHIYSKLNLVEAFRKAMMTWARWIDANIDPVKTLVFFRGYSAAHFRGGQWNSGGQCDSESEPIMNATYLSEYPQKMRVLEEVMKGMKTPVFFLNITRMTDYRKDAHPSIYRKQNFTEEERRSPLRFQDCSHWCLPGVPDTWNELLYVQLLTKHIKEQQQQRH